MQRLFGCGPTPTDILKVLVKDGGIVLSHVGPEMESSVVRLISIEESSVLVPNASVFFQRIQFESG